ncbi:hypothetical protein EMIT093MI4_60339 [Pseudomonas sp. IT-93MI4]
MVRGFIPDRLRSSRKTIVRGTFDAPYLLILGQLRCPSGINPLTTGLAPTGGPWCSGGRRQEEKISV